MTRIRYQEAAGLEVKRGRPSAGPAPSKEDLVRLYVKEGKSIREVADVLGCSKDIVHARLKDFGIAVRSRARRSGLRKIPLRELKAAVRAKGISGVARDLGVDEGTVRHHLKVRLGKNQQGKIGNCVG